MSRIIISLTTLPKRLKYLRPVIRSLLRQSVADYEVRLNLPFASWRSGERFEWDLPRYLRTSPITTEMVIDYGPLTKLLPTLAAAGPDDIVVTADDDVIYHRNWLKDLLYYAQRYPEAAVGYRGITFSRKPFRYSDVISYGDVMKYTRIRDPLAIDLLTGVFGILYRPRFFDLEALGDVATCPDAYYADDIWINGHLVRRRVPRICVPSRGRIRFQRDRKDIVKLFHVNRDTDHNDNVINYFRTEWEAHWAKSRIEREAAGE